MVNLRETWKSKIEVHCVKPQIQDQSKWVRAKKSFQLIWWAFPVFKGTTIPLLPSKPHQTSWHYFPYIWTKLTKLVSQAGAFPGKTLWIPNIWSATHHKGEAMSQWIKRWSIDFPLLWHIQPMPVHKKNNHPLRNLNKPNTFPREKN